jgi:hypothetical protein
MRWTLRIGDVAHGTPRAGKREDAVLPFVLFALVSRNLKLLRSLPAALSENYALALAPVAAYFGWTSGAPR